MIRTREELQVKEPLRRVQKVGTLSNEEFKANNSRNTPSYLCLILIDHIHYTYFQ